MDKEKAAVESHLESARAAGATSTSIARATIQSKRLPNSPTRIESPTFLLDIALENWRNWFFGDPVLRLIRGAEGIDVRVFPCCDCRGIDARHLPGQKRCGPPAPRCFLRRTVSSRVRAPTHARDSAAGWAYPRGADGSRHRHRLPRSDHRRHGLASRLRRRHSERETIPGHSRAIRDTNLAMNPN